ncbi:hypothetical protein EGW08_001380 [Elysia chlorotica]|uniref:Uncharacterized protein n=1 Tax=Elysia chlorotica TaxID=188477 RepID=A0A3S1BT32_ELYCH|nr:hypothetical protein EGW08_001380 [Elysia chlorotica]
MGSRRSPTCDVLDLALTYFITGATWILVSSMDIAPTLGHNLEATTSYPWSTYSLQTSFPTDDELCCSGVLGYASDNASSNFPCQRRPCCNVSEIHAVLSVDHALGFRFQCMPRTSIQVLCYENGVEVRTSNQDPDFTPRACCPGLKFDIVLNQWFAALVVRCVEMDHLDRVRLDTVARRAASLS